MCCYVSIVEKYPFEEPPTFDDAYVYQELVRHICKVGDFSLEDRNGKFYLVLFIWFLVSRS